MRIDEQPIGAVTLVKPVGPITEDDADQLRDRLLEVRARTLGRIALDVSAVPFIDGHGLESILDVSEEMARTGHVLRLCGDNEVVREILFLTGLSECFEHYADANAAARSFL
jgi:anti-anti-sigma factor